MVDIKCSYCEYYGQGGSDQERIRDVENHELEMHEKELFPDEDDDEDWELDIK